MFFSSIIINTSFFYLFLSILVSLLLSFFLYKKKIGLKDLPKHFLYTLFFLRFLVFFLLFFLLFKPELKLNNKIIENPKLVFLQDNTKSIISNNDSLFYQSQYLVQLDSISKLKTMDIEIIPFDIDLLDKEIDYEGQITNLNSVFKQVSNSFSNTNVGAYILASDGIYNEGFNPLYSDIFLNAPLYTVLLGDTMDNPDLSIKTIRNNKIGYLENKIPVEILIEAVKMEGSKVQLQVFNHQSESKYNKLIYDQIINIDNVNYTNNFKFFISPTQHGLQTYYVELKSITHSEKNQLNNKKYFFIDIIDNRKKILLLFSTPHPDVTAIKESLDAQDQYQVDSYWVSQENLSKIDYSKLDEYSLIIAHQLSNINDIELLSSVQDKPIWYIIGSNSKLDVFNNQQQMIVFENQNNIFEFNNVSLNKNFSSFLINDSIADFIEMSTPFLTPFSNYTINSFSEILLYKKVGSLVTDKPVLFFMENKYKFCFLIGEGLWRWRLNDTYLNGSNYIFNNFLGQIVQYMLLDEDKNRFHINYEPVQTSNSKVLLEAQLYNKKFELVNDYDVQIELIDSMDEQYSFKFYPVEDKYSLEIDLPNGEYSFVAKTNINNEEFIEKGDLLISNLNLESRNLVADYNLLNNLASSYNGKIFNKNQLSEEIDLIIQSLDAKPVVYYNYSFKSLINYKSLLILILFCLFLEWFIRRRYISY
ncbi:MAG: hypothetical protein CMP49_02635 [Flavobacteriales bacterium]|nr:hypothetical protein [Flavobacteriales bacterium]